MTENEHVKLGAYHTLELELQRAFTLHKARAGLCRMWPLLRLQLHCTVACSVCSQQHCNESLPSACAATAVCGWPAAWLQPTYLNAHCSTAAGCVGLCCQCPYFLPLFPQDVWDSVDAERVRTACDPAASADLAVLLITVGGILVVSVRFAAVGWILSKPGAAAHCLKLPTPRFPHQKTHISDRTDNFVYLMVSPLCRKAWPTYALWALHAHSPAPKSRPTSRASAARRRRATTKPWKASTTRRAFTTRLLWAAAEWS